MEKQMNVIKAEGGKDFKVVNTITSGSAKSNSILLPKQEEEGENEQGSEENAEQ